MTATMTSRDITLARIEAQADILYARAQDAEALGETDLADAIRTGSTAVMRELAEIDLPRGPRPSSHPSAGGAPPLRSNMKRDKIVAEFMRADARRLRKTAKCAIRWHESHAAVVLCQVADRIESAALLMAAEKDGELVHQGDER